MFYYFNRIKTIIAEANPQRLLWASVRSNNFFVRITRPLPAWVAIVFGADVNAKDDCNTTILHFVPEWGPSWGHNKIAELLINNGASVNAKDDNNVEPIFYAARFGSTKIVELLIKNGGDVNSKNEYDSVLSAAASQGHSGIVEMLIKNGARVNDKNIYGNTSLYRALMSNRKVIDVIKLLLNNGARKNFLNRREYSGLFIAIEYHYNEAVDLLISDSNVNERVVGLTPLHFAVHRNNTVAVAYLLNKGADVNARTYTSNNSGETALHIALSIGNEEIVHLLLSKGAKVNTRDDSRRTDLYYAIRGGNKNLIKLILDTKPNVNAKDKYGTTPLELLHHLNFVEEEKINIAKLLVTHGAIVTSEVKQYADILKPGLSEELIKLSIEHYKMTAHKEAANLYSSMRLFTKFEPEMVYLIFNHITSDLISSNATQQLTRKATGYHSSYEKYNESCKQQGFGGLLKQIVNKGPRKPSTGLKEIMDDISQRNHVEQVVRSYSMERG
jgi:ankyrin repeat protein